MAIHQVIERTNIKQVFPIVYKINNLTIYELTKNYSQDRKTIELILTKFQDLNLNLMMIIENNKFIDSLILFEKVKQNV